MGEIIMIVETISTLQLHCEGLEQTLFFEMLELWKHTGFPFPGYLFPKKPSQNLSFRLETTCYPPKSSSTKVKIWFYELSYLQ